MRKPSNRHFANRDAVNLDPGGRYVNVVGSQTGRGLRVYGRAHWALVLGILPKIFH